MDRVRFGGRRFAPFLLLLSLCGHGFAQSVDLKYDNKVEAARGISALTAEMFGQSVNDYSGATVFTQVDASIPGNGSLPVALGRTLSIENKFGTNTLPGFGDWDIDLPYIGGMYPSTGWTIASAASPDRYKRCSIPSEPYIGASGFTADQVWGGHLVHIPGGENGQLLVAYATDTYPEPTSGGPYPWITPAHSRIRCLPSTKNGYPGEAFVLLTSAGLVYTFDWGVEVTIRGVGKGDGPTIGRKRVYFLATKIEDQFGNSVTYSYSGSKLTAISSSDGRQISLAYSGDRVISASSSSGVVAYTYDGSGNLAKVTRPDGSFWSFNYNPNSSGRWGGLRFPPIADDLPDEDYVATCYEPGPPSGSHDYTIKHPSGAIGTFSWANERFYRSNVPWMCNTNLPPEPSYDWLIIQNYFDGYALKSLTISGPGMSSQVTTYDYGDAGSSLGFCTWNGSNCLHACNPQTQDCSYYVGRWVVISHPDGKKTKKYVGIRYGINEGRVLREQELEVNGTVRRDTNFTFIEDGDISLVPFSNFIGGSLRLDNLVAKSRPIRITSIVQDGVRFESRVDNDCSGKYCYDGLARQIKVTKSSAPLP